MPSSEVIVGIDLGTTNSLVAVFDDRGNQARVIPDEQGRALLPSVVRYGASNAGSPIVTVGQEAREHAAEFPGTTIASVKRLMGRSKADAAADLPFLPYKVVEGPHNTARVELPFGAPPVVVSPQEVSAAILRELKQRASRALGSEVAKAVVTVPAYFDDAQRHATRDAGRLAGLDVVRIVNEPTAAALAYGIGLGPTGARNTETVAVFDLGGGTFDISILKLVPGEQPGDTGVFQVIATAGDTHLGGDDVDHMLVDLFAREMAPRQARTGGVAGLSGGTRQALKDAAERAKRELSDREQTRVRVQVDHVLYERALSRAELEALMTPWVERAIDCCRRALRDAARSQESGIRSEGSGVALDAVIMVGGATRTPLVRQRVGEFFGLTPYTAVDPDEVVALGAAVQAGVLSGAVKGALLLDVIPLSLGIETMGGAVAKLIMRNSTVPARATEMFSTSVDGQSSIKLGVYQGEREMAADCRKLAEFHLRGVPPMPAGIPQVEVELLVDANGVLNVSAHERRSGRRAQLQVVPNHGLTREEVDRMEAESVSHARDDMTRHRVVDLVVNSKLDLKWIGERFERHRDKLEPSYAASLASQISALRSLVEAAEADWRSVDPNAFHAAKESLDRESVRLQEVSITESLREELSARTDVRRA